MQENSDSVDQHTKFQQIKQLTNQNISSRQQTADFIDDLTIVQKATQMIDGVTILLCNQIFRGKLLVQDQKLDLPIQRKSPPMTRNQSLNSKMASIDLEEHRRKVKHLMRLNKKYQQRLNSKTLQFQKSLKMLEQDQHKQKQQERTRQIQKRRSSIQNRMKSKSELMSQIRKMSLQSNQRFLTVKNQKFLYEQKQEQFKTKVILPKIQEQKKLLERRKDKMKSIDINEILEHEKNYQKKKKTQRMNRSMTSRLMKLETTYNPPEFVSKSYLLYQAQETKRKEQELMRIKEAEMSKEKAMKLAKEVVQMHKMQHQLAKSVSKSPKQKDSQQKVEKTQKKMRKIMSKQQATQAGNLYFKELLDQVKKIKQQRQLKAKLQQEEARKAKEDQSMNRDLEGELELEIKSEEIKTVQKIERIERNYKIRSKKIDGIFKDITIDPLLKYDKLKNQVDKLEMALKVKNSQSQDINQRTEAAGCYLNAIRAKLKLLEVSKK